MVRYIRPTCFYRVSCTRKCMNVLVGFLLSFQSRLALSLTKAVCITCCMSFVNLCRTNIQTLDSLTRARHVSHICQTVGKAVKCCSYCGERSMLAWYLQSVTRLHPVQRTLWCGTASTTKPAPTAGAWRAFTCIYVRIYMYSEPDRLIWFNLKFWANANVGLSWCIPQYNYYAATLMPTWVIIVAEPLVCSRLFTALR